MNDTTERTHPRRHTRVHTFRAVVLAILRSVGLVMVTVGVVMIANRILFATWGMGNIAQVHSTWMGIGETHGMFLGVPLMAVGVALALLSRRLSHWIVQAPATGCANCGYETLDENDRCAECGYR